ARRRPAAGGEGERLHLADAAHRRAGEAGDREDVDDGLPTGGRGVGVGGGHGLGAGRSQCDGEGVGTPVGGRERGVRRQRGRGVAAGEVNRARVAGGQVAVGVAGGHGDAPRGAAVHPAFEAGDGEAAGGGRGDGQVGRGEGERRGVPDRERLIAGRLERDA